MLGLWRYRRFIWDTAIADLRYRYAGSGLGVGAVEAVRSFPRRLVDEN